MSFLMTGLRWVAVGLALACGAPEGSRAEAAHLQVLIVIDGLRPDYVTPELMPNLHAFGERGIVGMKHHAVFPTVTRVNASSISTGSYPETHGLMGNSVYFPVLSPTQGLTTSDRSVLQRIDQATDGNLLTAQTLGEVLQLNGKKLLVVSSGSTGSAFLLNHKVSGGAIIHTDFTLPESLHATVVERLGEPAGDDGYPKTWAVDRTIDAFLEVGLPEVQPDAAILWLTEPDHTAHKAGVGAPTTVAALAGVDAAFGRLISGLEAKGLGDQTNIFVTSDHGFSTHQGRQDLRLMLVATQLKKELDSDDVVLVDGAIYVNVEEENRVPLIVKQLQRFKFIGPIFTRPANPGDAESSVPGTLSTDLARWSHDRSAEILISADWSHDKNDFGYAGTSFQKGVAGHGTSSPYDIHNTLIAAGPDIRSGTKSMVPSGNVDFAPTFLYLLGIEPPKSMTGRALSELLTDGPSPASVEVTTASHSVSVKEGTTRYKLTAFESVVGEHRYLDYTQVDRN